MGNISQQYLDVLHVKYTHTVSNKYVLQQQINEAIQSL